MDQAMREVPVFEARNSLTSLITEVEAGAEITITRRGQPVARLVPIDSGIDSARARRAAEGLRTLGAQLTLGQGLTIKDLVTEGRR
jgi:prevent-host-death family protein